MSVKTAVHNEETTSIGRRLDASYPRFGEPKPARATYSSMMHALLEQSGNNRSAFNQIVHKKESRNAMVMNLLESQEEERKRISRELHDGLGQLLTHLKLQTQQCLSDVVNSGKAELMGDSWKTLEQLPGLVSEAIEEVRAVCRALRPAILDDLGVLAATSALCRKVMQSTEGLRIECEMSICESDIPETAKAAIYRIVQEALTNCIKYADADLVQVSLRQVEGFLLLGIKDNGVGFDVKRMAGSGLGLLSMQERALSHQGTFSLESVPLQGTEIRVSIPLNKPLLS